MLMAAANVGGSSIARSPPGSSVVSPAQTLSATADRNDARALDVASSPAASVYSVPKLVKEALFTPFPFIIYRQYVYA